MHGEKKDLDKKLRVDLIHPLMIQGLVEGLEAGIRKGYEPWNWLKGLPLDSVSVAAATRHMLKWRSGVDIDPETEIHHLVAAMINLAMAVTQIKLGRVDLDDRPDVWNRRL